MELIKYENKFPDKRFIQIVEKIFLNRSWNQGLELIISIEDTQVNLKEIGDLFHLIYRIDGRLYEKGMKSYSHSRKIQATTNFNKGTLQIILDTLQNNIDPQSLIIIWLTLKYLPNLLTSFSGSLVNFTEGLKNYGDYQATMIEVRRGRKELRELINSDGDLNNLEKKDKEKLIKLIQEICVDNKKNVPGTIRLLKDKLKEIKMRIKEKNTAATNV